MASERDELKVEHAGAPPSEEPGRNKPARRRKKRRRRASSSGSWARLATLFIANTPFLVTRVLFPLLLFAAVGGTITYVKYRHTRARMLDQLAEKLWDDVRGGSADPSARPYVRGQLAIVETQVDVRPEHQDTSKPLYWVNDYFEPPLSRPETIGSVILIEWKMFAGVARNASGGAMGLRRPQGPSAPGDDDPVMLKKWRCSVRLIDRKRRLVVYQANLNPPERTFTEGEKVLTTPSTSVTPNQLAVEFDKIRAFPQIGLDDDPPEAKGGEVNGKPNPPAPPGGPLSPGER